MDSIYDNNKINESDNTTQALISNANTDINTKPDDGNNRFENRDEQLSDGLNNVIGLTADFTKETNKNLILHENNAISSNPEKNAFENDGDMGPETCVDAIDDVDHDHNLLECSTLSHSKETLPSSDNPSSDNKFSSQEFDMFDIQQNAEKSVSPISPSNQHHQLSAMSEECQPAYSNPFMVKQEEEDKTESDFMQGQLVDFNNLTEAISEEAKEFEQIINKFIPEPMDEFQTETNQFTLEPNSIEKPTLLLSETPTSDIDTMLDNNLSTDELALDRKPQFTETNELFTNTETGNIAFEGIETNTELKSPSINNESMEHFEHRVEEEIEEKTTTTLQTTTAEKFSTDDDNKSDLDFESYSKEQIQKEILTSSDISEPKVEQENNVKEDQHEIESNLITEDDQSSSIPATSDISELLVAQLENTVDDEKKETESTLRDIVPHKPDEFDSTTPHESCDESADEWNYTKPKSEILKEDDSDKIQLEENANNESKESEELNKKEPEEKTSETSVEHSEHFEEKYSESLVDKEVEDMTSQLNPDAKEFVPTTSPVLDMSKSPILLPVSPCLNGDNVARAQSPQTEDVLVPNQNELVAEIAARPPTEPDASSTESPEHGLGEMRPSLVAQFTHCLNGDDLVAQSPRKGAISMDDFEIPTEKDFESEIANRPSEIDVDASEPYQELNLKEAMHGSEKEEQSSPDEQYGNSTFESADMRTSIYVDNTLGKMEDVMNKIQQLPNDLDDSKDAEKLQDISDESTAPLVLLSADEPAVVQPKMNGESSHDDFNIKSLAEAANEEKKCIENKSNKVAAAGVKKIDPKTKTSVAPKKAVSSTSTTSSDNAKLKTTQTASKTRLVAATAAARPRTAPVSSSKPIAAEKKMSTNSVSARAKTETKVTPPVGIKKLPITKPKTEEPKTSVRQPPTKVGVTLKSTSRTASTTSTATTTKRAPVSASISSTKTLGQRPTLSPNTKTASISATSKPTMSPRSTVTSTLRKTEAVKSPTGTKTTTVRTTTTTTTAKPLGTIRHKTTSTTTANKLPTTTSTKAAVSNKPAAISKTSTAIKKPATMSTTTTTIKQNSVSSTKAENCEIKLNGSSNGENKN